jgi:hypothetical protein
MASTFCIDSSSIASTGLALRVEGARRDFVGYAAISLRWIERSRTDFRMPADVVRAGHVLRQRVQVRQAPGFAVLADLLATGPAP